MKHYLLRFVAAVGFIVAVSCAITAFHYALVTITDSLLTTLTNHRIDT